MTGRAPPHAQAVARECRTDIVGTVVDSDGTTITSDVLLRGRDTVTIEHRGERYRLRETRAGKLILTK